MAIIEKLHILKFRNLDNQYLELNKNINLFIGSNGQGKTNLIEGIYYLGHNRSFKTKNIKDVVPFEEDFLQIKGSINYSGREVLDNEFHPIGFQCLGLTRGKYQVPISVYSKYHNMRRFFYPTLASPLDEMSFTT